MKHRLLSLSFLILFPAVSFGQVIPPALGAASSSHVAITVVSAISTVIAGNLALMKGQGLPGRVRSDWASWKSVRDYIEEREGEIAAGMVRIAFPMYLSTLSMAWFCAQNFGIHPL